MEPRVHQERKDQREKEGSTVLMALRVMLEIAVLTDLLEHRARREKVVHRDLREGGEKWEILELLVLKAQVVRLQHCIVVTFLQLNFLFVAI